MQMGCKGNLSNLNERLQKDKALLQTFRYSSYTVSPHPNKTKMELRNLIQMTRNENPFLCKCYIKAIHIEITLGMRLEE